MNCPECGTKLKDDGIDYYFCPDCGYERAFGKFQWHCSIGNRKLKIER